MSGKYQKLSVVVPAYNEEATVETVLNAIAKVNLLDDIKKEIIVVDDGSKDNTVARVNNYIQANPNVDVKLYEHKQNRGKGAALHSGFEKATGDLVIVQDADLEYDPEEINILLKPILNGYADVVYGSRFMGGKAHRVLFFWHSIGNGWLTFLSNMCTNLNLTDMETCYKLFRADILKSMQLKENQFGFEPEVTAKVSRVPNVRIYEVGISYYGRTYAEGKKINWKDGFQAIYCILKYGFFKA